MIYFGYEAQTAINDRDTSNTSTDADDNEIKVQCKKERYSTHNEPTVT